MSFSDSAKGVKFESGRVRTSIEPSRSLVSIVISSLNGGDRLLACLRSLSLQIYPSVEVFVIDNGSVDGSPNAVSHAFPNVKLVRNTRNLGFAGGGNLGASMAHGEFLLFLNHDMEFATDFIDELVQVMSDDPEIGIAQSMVLKMDDRETVDSIGSFMTPTGFVLHRSWFAKNGHSGSRVEEIFGGAGGAIMVRTKPFTDLGGFDTDFLIYSEDIDLSWRFWLAGLKVVLASNSIIFHIGGDTTTRMPSEFVIFHSFKNRLCTLIKNLSRKDMVKVLSIHITICLMGSIMFFATLKVKNGWGVLRALFWNVRNLSTTIRKREAIQAISTSCCAVVPEKLSRKMPLRYFISTSGMYLLDW